MHKKLSQIGSSWGLIMPKVILELIKVNPVKDEVEIVVVEDEIRIKKYKEEN